jgi:hypothetical protein
MKNKQERREGETKLTLTCPEDLRARLDGWCASHKETLSHVISQALSEFLSIYRRKRPRYLSTRQPYVLLQFWLRDELAERFFAKVSKDGVSQSSLLITALEDYFVRMKPPPGSSRSRRKPTADE